MSLIPLLSTCLWFLLVSSFTGYICKFSGVTCWHDDENRVLSINLSGFGLEGEFPLGIKRCSDLTSLDLSRNNFSGVLPSNIASLIPSVTILDLSYNQFSGEIPAGLSNVTLLNSLMLQHNQFTGQLPPKLESLQRLNQFSVADNHLTGPVPKFNEALGLGVESFANNTELCGSPMDYCVNPEEEIIWFGKIGAATGAAVFAPVGLFLGLTSLSETPPGKSSPATPKVARLSRAANKSETTSPSSRLSLDRSSPSSKSTSVERRSPKVPTPPEKTQARAAAKGSSAEPTQTRLTLTQIKEDLKKANEKISSLEKEKAKALDELKEAKKEAEEASLKLDDALKAQNNIEVEKFQAVEAGIEAVQMKEEELKKELENVKSQHASVTQELQKVNEELAKANEVKSKALIQADDSSKTAQLHAEKVEILSSELTRLKTLLDSSESEMVGKLEEEIDVLKRDLERARSFESEVKEQEMIIKKLNADLEAANSSSEEWKSEAKEVESQLQEAKNLERCASLSLESVMKQLEGSNDKLHETESELINLKEKIMTLETTVARQKEDLKESEEQLSKTEKELESLKNELETVVEEKNRALDKEQDASSNVQRLLEQKKKLLADFETSKEEEEKSKKAMETLASALHEVSSEGRELKEKLLSQGGGDQEYEAQIEDLKLVIKATSEKYETMLDESRHEIDVLVSAVEQTKKHFESSKTEWEMKEAKLVDHVRKMEEEVASMSRLDGLLKRTEEEADAAWKKEAETKESLKEVEDEVVYLQECLGEAKAESMKLKESLLEKDSEFESVVHENEELRVKEGVALRKIEELSKLLEEARLRKEEVEVSESEKEYDLLPKVVEFSSENGHRSVEEKSPEVKTIEDEEDPQEHISNGNGNGMEEKDMNGKPEEAKTEMKEKKEESPDDDDDKDNSVEVIFKMWESCQVEKKEAVTDKKTELESPEEEEDSRKIDESDKASTENVEDEVVMEKKIKKKKTLLGKVFSRRKQQ
ncbi:hypothetical protein Bca4012_000839 [Brassica carinata]